VLRRKFIDESKLDPVEIRKALEAHLLDAPEIMQAMHAPLMTIRPVADTHKMTTTCPKLTACSSPHIAAT
jgi:hypothetical protein